MTYHAPCTGDRGHSLPAALSLLWLSTLAACAGPGVAATSPSTVELRILFEEDQSIRASGFQGFSSEEIRAVIAEDAVRKARVLELLAEDALQEPDDCYLAAMVLQHGDQPIDFLLAHVLSAAAAQDGHEGARWLSAASLDRYLMAIDQPQVFRTQFNSQGGGPWTQDPTTDLLGDALRDRFDVPSLGESKASLEGMNAD